MTAQRTAAAARAVHSRLSQDARNPGLLVIDRGLVNSYIQRVGKTSEALSREFLRVIHDYFDIDSAEWEGAKCETVLRVLMPDLNPQWMVMMSHDSYIRAYLFLEADLRGTTDIEALHFILGRGGRLLRLVK